MNRIRQLRKMKGLTQKQLGKMVGKTDASICLYETGYRKPPVPVAKKLAKTLGCCWEEFYVDDDSPTKEAG